MPASDTRESGRGSDRAIAVITGILFIVATAGAIAAAAIVPSLRDPDYLEALSAAGTRVAGGVLLYLVAAFGSAGIAVAMYPVLRRWNPALAVGAIVFRTIEAVMYVVGAMCLLSMLTLGVHAAAPVEPSVQAIADALRALRAHASLAGVFSFCLGACAYYLLFWQSRVVPRWLAGFGLVAIALMFAACILALFSDTDITSYVYLALPIAVQEMVLAVWLIARGFNPAAVAPASTAD